MANMYLRVAHYVAQFYRNRDENNRLGPFDPIALNDNYAENILARSLRLDGSRGKSTVLCYSQQSWENILKGKLPYGGTTIFKRDPKTWPTMKEICALEGRSLNLHEEIFDYLCIALPAETMFNGEMVKVNKAFSLDAMTAQHLANHLRYEYNHIFSEWLIQERRLFASRGLMLTDAEALERFLAQYEIKVSPKTSDKNSMRMAMKRMLGKAEKKQTQKRSPVGGEFFGYVSQESNKPIA